MLRALRLNEVKTPREARKLFPRLGANLTLGAAVEQVPLLLARVVVAALGHLSVAPAWWAQVNLTEDGFAALLDPHFWVPSLTTALCHASWVHQEEHRSDVQSRSNRSACLVSLRTRPDIHQIEVLLPISILAMLNRLHKLQDPTPVPEPPAPPQALGPKASAPPPPTPLRKAPAPALGLTPPILVHRCMTMSGKRS